jgi:hypothetical protein
MTVYSYCIANQTTTSAGTGTLSSSGVTVTGSGTNFDPEVNAGDVIHAAGQNLVVATRAGGADTTLTVVTAPSPTLSGASFTITALVAGNVETIGAAVNLKAPHGIFKPAVDSINLGNGLARSIGRPVAAWSWGFLTQAQRNILRAFCTGKSARVYITTRVNDSSDVYVTYDAVMLWPDEEKKFATRRTDFILEFRDLIAL